METGKPLLQFASKLTILTITLTGLVYGMAYFVPSLTPPVLLPFMLSYFYVYTLLVHGILMAASKDQTQMSIAYFLATITGKLILNVIVIGLLAYLFPAQMVELVISFFLLYIIFTVFEILYLAPVLRRNNMTK